MARTYSYNRCAVCGKLVSKNGFATLSHNRTHVKQGLTIEIDRKVWAGSKCKVIIIPRDFETTEAGQVIAQESKAALKSLDRNVMEAFEACQVANKSNDTLAWKVAYAAMTSADKDKREYQHPFAK